MLSKQKLVAAVLGLAMMAVPATALAHGHGHGWGHWHHAPVWNCNRGPAWQAHRGPWEHDDDNWRHDDDDWGWGPRRPGNPGLTREFQGAGRSGYYGGYNGAYNNSSQPSYLIQRRSAAWANYRAARARGDKDAEHRLGNVIHGLSTRIRRENGGHNLKGNYAYAPGPSYSYNQSYVPSYYGPQYGSPLGAVIGQFLGW
ncbi:MAG: hypothetical protein ACREQ4_05750 [Candidatus Binataceae bacterium]